MALPTKPHGPPVDVHTMAIDGVLFILETLQPKKWTFESFPEEIFLVKENGKERITLNGESYEIPKYKEIIPTSLGLTILTYDKFIDLTKKGKTWKVVETKKIKVPPSQREEVKTTIWTLQWK
jgi:hypothetical protein